MEKYTEHNNYTHIPHVYFVLYSHYTQVMIGIHTDIEEFYIVFHLSTVFIIIIILFNNIRDPLGDNQYEMFMFEKTSF